MLEPPSVPSSSFFCDELERALAECGFGILGWAVEMSNGATGSSAAQSLAKVELLPKSDSTEEKAVTITVRLTIQGYEVIHGPAGEGTAGKHFETLDDLLCKASPAFEQRRTKLLFAKLEDVAKTRSWDVDEYDQE